MGQLVFYFDRTFGTRLPQALHSMQPPAFVRWHQEQGFAANMHDDAWLSIVGPRRWIVLSQDRKFHLLENELLAIKQHSIKCFYMPCASDDRWTTLCHFVSRHQKIGELAVAHQGPFIYEMKNNRQFYRVKLP